jgi:hypothetical protein
MTGHSYYDPNYDPGVFNVQFTQDPNTGICTNFAINCMFGTNAVLNCYSRTQTFRCELQLRVGTAGDVVSIGSNWPNPQPDGNGEGPDNSGDHHVNLGGWTYTPTTSELQNGQLNIQAWAHSIDDTGTRTPGNCSGYINATHHFTPPDNTPPTIDIDLSTSATPVGSYYTTTDSSAKVQVRIQDSGSGPKSFDYRVVKYDVGSDGLSVGAEVSATGWNQHTGAGIDIPVDPDFLITVEVQNAKDVAGNTSAGTSISHTYTVALQSVNVTNEPTPTPTAVSGCVDLWQPGFPTDGIITATQLASSSKILAAYEGVWGTDHSAGQRAGYANNLEWALDWYDWITGISSGKSALHSQGSNETAASNPGGGPKTIADCFSTDPGDWNRSGGSSGWYSGLFARGQEGTSQMMAGWLGTKAPGQFFPNSVAFHLHRYGIYWGYDRLGGQWGSGHIRNTGSASERYNCHRRRDAWITQCIIAWQAGWKYPPYNSGSYSGGANGWAGSTSTPSDPGYNDQPCGIDEMFINLGITLHSPGYFKVDDCIPPTINAVNIRSLTVSANGNYYYADYSNTGTTCSFEVDATDEQYGLANAHYTDTDTGTTYIEDFTSNIDNETIELPISIMDGSGNPRTHIPIEVTAYDAAGNPSTPVTNTVHIDIGLPQISIDPTNSRNTSGRTGRGSTSEAGTSPTDQWVGPNKSYTIGAFDVVDALTGIKEYSLEYSTSLTAPTPTFVSVNSPISFNQIETVVLDDESTTSKFTTPSTLSLPGGLSDGDSVYLHMHVKDLADNESLPATREYHYDSDLPQFANVYFNSSQTSVSGSTLAIFGEVWDETSGVTYLEFHDGHITEPTKISTLPHPIFDPSFELSDNFKDTNKLYIQDNPNIPSNSGYPISTTAGARQVSIIAMDQSDNYAVEHWSFTHSGCDVTWGSVNVSRASNCPFLIEGSFDAQVSGCSAKIQGFFVSVDVSSVPPTNVFDTSVGAKAHYTSAATSFSLPVIQSNAAFGTIYLWLDDNSFALKQFSITGVDYSAISSSPPTPVISSADGRIYTNKTTNNYRIQVTAGSVAGGQDLITGYCISENSSHPAAEAPTYNSSTRKFEGSNSNWEVSENGQVEIDTVDNYTFGGSFGSKTVYLHTSTFAYSGEILPQQVFSSTPFTMNYVNDFDGPSATGVTVNGSSTTASGSPSSRTFTSSTDVTSSFSVGFAGTITDSTGVWKWYLSNAPSPPAEFSSNWNVISGISTSVPFSGSLNTIQINGIKTVYLHMIDVVGNSSTELIKFNLQDPALVPTPIGTTGAPGSETYKLEGKPAEHVNRASVVSMFGDGVGHTGFISKDLLDQTVEGQLVKGISSIRIHDLSNYRGLRVRNTATDAIENLPAAMIRLSDFIGKTPVVSNLNIIAASSGLSDSAPTTKGDTRTLTLTVDIDTGSGSTPNWQTDLIDIYTTWVVSVSDPQTGAILPAPGFTPTQGRVLNYNFATAGVYIVSATSSFGPSSTRTFIIWDPGGGSNTSPVPQTQGPPIIVTIPTLTGGGTTPVEVPLYVNQLSPGCDAVFVVDGSGSYYPDFTNTLSANAPALFDKIDQFSMDASTGTPSSRFAMLSFGASVMLDVSFPSSPNAANRNDVQTKLADPNDKGWIEPKIEAIAKAAEGMQGAWRERVCRLIMLFSDERDSGDGQAAGHCSSPAYWNPANTSTYYINLLKQKEIGLIVFDAGAGAADDDDLPTATSETAIYGGKMSTMSLSSSGADMAAAVEGAFQSYQSTVKFSLESAIQVPAIVQSVSAPAHGAYPVPYANLHSATYMGASTKVAKFQVVLDHNEINNLRVPGQPVTIATYAIIYNSSNVPIAQRQLNIVVP